MSTSDMGKPAKNKKKGDKNGSKLPDLKPGSYHYYGTGGGSTTVNNNKHHERLERTFSKKWEIFVKKDSCCPFASIDQGAKLSQLSCSSFCLHLSLYFHTCCFSPPLHLLLSLSSFPFLTSTLTLATAVYFSHSLIFTHLKAKGSLCLSHKQHSRKSAHGALKSNFESLCVLICCALFLTLTLSLTSFVFHRIHPLLPQHIITMITV